MDEHTAQVIKGTEVAAALKEQMKRQIAEEGLSPCLAVVRAGNDESDLAYLKGIASTCKSVGIELRIFEFPEEITQEAFEERFREINEDPSVHGILLLRPLPFGLQEARIAQRIDPEKDMDCMSPVNWAKLVTGDNSGYFPCTAEAVICMLDAMKVDYNGARAVVIGRSQVIGKPVGLMLLARNTTLTWCHSRTRDLARMCEGAEILVAACGVPKLVDETIARGISPACAAVDVGVNFVDGKMQGDLDFDAVSRFAGKITPVPGGVGAVTNTILASHVVRAASKKAASQLHALRD